MKLYYSVRLHGKSKKAREALESMKVSFTFEKQFIFLAIYYYYYY